MRDHHLRACCSSRIRDREHVWIEPAHPCRNRRQPCRSHASTLPLHALDVSACWLAAIRSMRLRRRLERLRWLPYLVGSSGCTACLGPLSHRWTDFGSAKGGLQAGSCTGRAIGVKSGGSVSWGTYLNLGRG